MNLLYILCVSFVTHTLHIARLGVLIMMSERLAIETRAYATTTAMMMSNADYS